VTNFYPFKSDQRSIDLFEYKVTVHPKMEKAVFYKQRKSLIDPTACEELSSSLGLTCRFLPLGIDARSRLFSLKKVMTQI
jgi:hypothetical protein